LRRLQYGDRPVTSTETKKRIEELFSASSVGNGQAATSVANSSPSLITYRSPVVLNEISDLGQRQRVSSLLTSNRDLFERSLQNLIQNRQATLQTGQHFQPVPSVQPIPDVRSVAPSRRILPFLEARNSTSNPIEEMTREQIISEISELVHNQLVTNALQNTEFRSRLEQRGSIN
jgi:hypothetical protein